MNDNLSNDSIALYVTRFPNKSTKSKKNYLHHEMLTHCNFIVILVVSSKFTKAKFTSKRYN